MPSSLERYIRDKGFYGYPNFGEIHWVVKSDERTQAQGWTRSDGTGPLDLYSKLLPGFCYRTGDYSSQSVAIQAAIDAAVDYRGDVVMFTPGSYTIATALAVNCADLRFLGPETKGSRPRVNITNSVASAFGITAGGIRSEFAHIRFIPLTAQPTFNVTGLAHGLYFHDFSWDTRGIATSTSTKFLTSDQALQDFRADEFKWWTDAAQGPVFTFSGATKDTELMNFKHFVEAGTDAVSLAAFSNVVHTCVLIKNGRGVIGGGGAASALASLADQTANTCTLTVDNFRGMIGYCAASGLVSKAGTAAEVNIVNSYLDVVSGGAGGSGTAYTA